LSLGGTCGVCVVDVSLSGDVDDVRDLSDCGSNKRRLYTLHKHKSVRRW